MYDGHFKVALQAGEWYLGHRDQMQECIEGGFASISEFISAAY